MAIDWENYGRERYGRTNVVRRPQYSGKPTESYVEGNTVRKMTSVPKRKEEPKPERHIKQYPQRQPVRLPGISPRAFVFLTCMLCAVLYMGFNYLSLQGNVRQQKASIVAMQSQIAQEREDNDETRQAVLDSVDISEIYKKATKKLKMIQAQDNQIYTYKNKKSDMVKQYADIPGAEE